MIWWGIGLYNFLLGIIASILVSLVSFIGIFILLMKEEKLEKILIFLVAISAGSLIGGSFLHILPEAMEKTDNIVYPFLWVILGFTVFFFLEKYLFWRHCHKDNCDIHSFTYLNLIGDGLHNFLDGIIIAISFSNSIKLGLIATLMIIIHEIPQELGDFGVLLYGGIKPRKAIFLNFITALSSVLGTIFGFCFSFIFNRLDYIFTSLVSGGFIYIAASDLIPELHNQKDKKISIETFCIFLLGLFLMWFLRNIH